MTTTHVVNLAGIRAMLDHDETLVRQLLQTFLTSSEPLLAQLHANTMSDGCEAWRKAAHALKGNALNLGAPALAESCREAQERADASEADKHVMLEHIQQDFTAVKQDLSLYLH